MAFSRLAIRKGFTVSDPNLNTLLDEIVRALNATVTEKTQQVDALDTRIETLETGDGGVSAHSALTDDEPLRHIDMRDDDLEGTVIDFAGPKVLRNTLGAGNTTLTIANPVVNHTVMVRFVTEGDSTLTLPVTCTVIKGAFRSGVDNVVFIFCEDATTPSYLVSYAQSTVDPLMAYALLLEDGTTLLTEDGELLLMEY